MKPSSPNRLTESSPLDARASKANTPQADGSNGDSILATEAKANDAKRPSEIEEGRATAMSQPMPPSSIFEGVKLTELPQQATAIDSALEGPETILREVRMRFADGQKIPRPEFVAATDVLWGSEFWTIQESECRNYFREKESVTLLAQAIRELTAPEVASWLEPVRIAEDVDLWIIGDLHGDLLSFRVLTEFAKRTSSKAGRKPQWCFLGDLFDDGPGGQAVLFETLQLLRDPRNFLVVGNHDLSLKWDQQSNQFTADVSPREFTDWLNKPGTGEEWRELGKAASNWFNTARRALLLADGTLVAHGGCVHSDRLSLLMATNGHLHPEVLEDLVWLRASENSKRKIPNRTSRGCQFGVDDFRDFLVQMEEKTGLPIIRVIRGHDHVLERWAAPKRYEGRLLTLNAMSWRQREVVGPFARQPVIARYRPAKFPELYQMEIPVEIVNRLYGEMNPRECTSYGE